MECPYAPVVKDLLLLAPYTQIVHHVPGRIRLKVSFSGLRFAQQIDLKKTVGCLPGVLNAQVNKLARTAVIEYDPHQLPFELLEKLGRIKESPELAREVEHQLKTLWS